MRKHDRKKIALVLTCRGIGCVAVTSETRQRLPQPVVNCAANVFKTCVP